MSKTVPFTKEQIEALAAEHPTPFYVYDAEGMRAQVQGLLRAFSWDPKFKQYFSVKALPNPEILKLMKTSGCGADCSSMPELLIADKAGVTGADIMFSSNDTPAKEFVAARERGAIINLDSVELLDSLEKTAGLPDIISFRYTPLLKFGNAIIGEPLQRKFGITREQVFEAYAASKAKGIKRFAIHSMPVSNDLSVEHLLEAARELLLTAKEVQEKVGISFEFANLGGGLGIPYRPEETAIDIEAFGQGVRKMRDEIFPRQSSGQVGQAPSIATECGRYITGPHGYLVASVRHLKRSYKQYAGLDATMANLMRPGMYGAYHHITVLGKENVPASQTYDVVGSLCENNDKFAIDRQLPALAEGDLVVIHDAGAHGHAMGFNYNGKLRSAEFLLDNGSFTMIRRAETVDDYFATLHF